MKKIAVIDLLFHWPAKGGSWIDVYENCKHLSMDNNIEIKLFVPYLPVYFPRGIIKKRLPFKIERIPFKLTGFNYYNAPRKIYRAVKKFEPDTVFITDGYYMKPHLVNYLSKYYPVILRFYAYEIFCGRNNLYSPLTYSNCDNNLLIDKKLCEKCLKLNPLKFIFKVLLRRNLHPEHEYFMSGAFQKKYARTFIDSLKNAEHIIVYNEYIKNLIYDINNKITILPTGIDTSVFKPADNPKPNETFTLFFPGRILDTVKGFITIQAAVNILKKKNIDVNVWYTPEDNKNIIDDDSFINIGWVDRTEIIEYYQDCDAVVCPSKWREAFGITVVEGLSCGKPVIGSKTGGIMQTIKDRINGLHFEPENPNDLADKIELLIKDKNLYNNLCNNARESVVDKYEITLITSELKQLF